MVKTKKCSRCGTDKPISEFNKRANSRDGTHYVCRLCQKADNDQAYWGNRESRLARQKEYYHERADKERIRKYQIEYRIKNAERRWDCALQKQYGISLEEYRAILSKQGGGCAICGAKEDKRKLCVDHDHATGKVRGILCSNCNFGLGKFKDDPGLLRNALRYLRDHTKDTQKCCTRLRPLNWAKR